MIFTVLTNAMGGVFKLHRMAQASRGLQKKVLYFIIGRFCEENGSSLGKTTSIEGPIYLFHGFKGVFISNKAKLGKNIKLYQNVMIVSKSDSKTNKWVAPVIEDDVLIGAGAILIGGIRVGKGSKIGAGAVVSTDVPPGATVVSQPARILIK